MATVLAPDRTILPATATPVLRFVSRKLLVSIEAGSTALLKVTDTLLAVLMPTASFGGFTAMTRRLMVVTWTLAVP